MVEQTAGDAAASFVGLLAADASVAGLAFLFVVDCLCNPAFVVDGLVAAAAAASGIAVAAFVV